ncbi:MAG: aldo/keto reductase [Deltaproteobacteria bacterium]|nr:aldo/keto reductase [Deltaproteobacteria bacterium]
MSEDDGREDGGRKGVGRKNDGRSSGHDEAMNRRSFLRKTGASALGLGALGLTTTPAVAAQNAQQQNKKKKNKKLPPLPYPASTDGLPHIQRYRPLGNTGMKISDVSLGSGGVNSPDTVRLAYELGINYFDTAEMYEKGRAERFIGEALKGKRDKVYITSKVLTQPEWKREQMMTELEGSLKRLQTDYVDIYMNHAVNRISRIQSPEWHEFVALAKKQGKIRFSGMSGHAGNLQKCLNYAVDNDLVDVILTAYNFGTDPAFYEKYTKAFDFIANQAGLPQVLAKARKKGIGTIAMKTQMGAKLNDMQPYEWGDATFSQAAFRWVFTDPNVDALIVSMRSLRQVIEYVGASGQVGAGGVGGLGKDEARLLREYVRLANASYCRNDCGECESSCPASVSIPDVLRARMYAVDYGAGEMAQDSYERAKVNAAACESCSNPTCLAACPYGVAIPELTREAARLLG